MSLTVSHCGPAPVIKLGTYELSCSVNAGQNTATCSLPTNGQGLLPPRKKFEHIWPQVPAAVNTNHSISSPRMGVFLHRSVLGVVHHGCGPKLRGSLEQVYLRASEDNRSEHHDLAGQSPTTIAAAATPLRTLGDPFHCTFSLNILSAGIERVPSTSAAACQVSGGCTYKLRGESFGTQWGKVILDGKEIVPTSQNHNSVEFDAPAGAGFIHQLTHQYVKDERKHD